MTKPPQPLTPPANKRLLAYAAMAGAGIAATASSAQAEIVYTSIHQNVNYNFYLDLNHDGVNDFLIHSYYLSAFASLKVTPLVSGNKVVSVHQSCRFQGSSTAAAPLQHGAAIGPKSPFKANATCMMHGKFSSSSTGPWVGEKDHYLGLEFYINGKKHFGWARLSVQSKFDFGGIGRVLGYAYETVADKAITAGDEGKGEPSSADESSAEPTVLGALALGSQGLDLWRREQVQ